jgi:hypothetical protein
MALASGEGLLRKLIVTAAITGSGPTPTMLEYLPLTPLTGGERDTGLFTFTHTTAQRN